MEKVANFHTQKKIKKFRPFVVQFSLVCLKNLPLTLAEEFYFSEIQIVIPYACKRRKRIMVAFRVKNYISPLSTTEKNEREIE